MHLKTSTATWRPFCLGLGVFTYPNVVISRSEVDANTLQAGYSIHLNTVYVYLVSVDDEKKHIFLAPNTGDIVKLLIVHGESMYGIGFCIE